MKIHEILESFYGKTSYKLNWGKNQNTKKQFNFIDTVKLRWSKNKQDVVATSSDISGRLIKIVFSQFVKSVFLVMNKNI